MYNIEVPITGTLHVPPYVDMTPEGIERTYQVLRKTFLDLCQNAESASDLRNVFMEVFGGQYERLTYLQFQLTNPNANMGIDYIKINHLEQAAAYQSICAIILFFDEFSKPHCDAVFGQMPLPDMRHQEEITRHIERRKEVLAEKFGRLTEDQALGLYLADCVHGAMCNIETNLHATVFEQGNQTKQFVNLSDFRTLLYPEMVSCACAEHEGKYKIKLESLFENAVTPGQIIPQNPTPLTPP